MEQNSKIGILIATFFALLVLCFGAAYLGYSFNQYQSRIDEQNYNFTQGRGEGEKVGHEKGFQEGYVAGLKEKGGYVLRDPTYQEVKEFLAADDSNNKSYIKDEHICTDFTAEVNNNAEKKGIRCATVYIIYPETGHSIVAFNTTDKGMIFIEPQFDREVKLVIGKSYSQTNGFLKQSGLDDTIIRYLMMW